MIIGNPREFAVWIDSVPLWSTPTIENGVFAYVIEEEIIPPNPFSSTIGADVVAAEFYSCMGGPVGDVGIAGIDKDTAFHMAFDRAFPSDESQLKESDYTYLASPQSFRDSGNIFFFFEGKEHDRLLYSPNWENGPVREFFLPQGAFVNTLRQAIRKWRERHQE
jgi:hypothetical protein